MMIIKTLQKLLQGRGVYPIFMVLASWTYVIIMLVYLMIQIFLYIFKVKYHNKNFADRIHKQTNKGE